MTSQAVPSLNSGRWAAKAVPFNRAYVSAGQLDYINAAIASGELAGDGPFTGRASTTLRDMTGARMSLLTTSCTHALELAALLLDLTPGDEVIIPSFTFMSAANAFALRDAVPVFVDCRRDTLNMDERLLEDAITERTRAIVPVHYAGVACEMDSISAIAAKYGLVVIEDNAHGLGGTYFGRPLGALGALAAQSFHVTKNVQCGEGGALLLNDAAYISRAEIIREKGTNRQQFFQGLVDKYRWVDIGSSYLMSDLLAAVLTAQLEDFPEIQRKRRAVWAAYHAELASWAREQGVTQPTVPVGHGHPAHIYYLLMPDLANRQGILRHLSGHGVEAAFHYQPLHTAPAAARYGRTAPGGCPVTEQVADRLIRLPVYPGLTDEEMGRVLEAVTSYRVGL